MAIRGTSVKNLFLELTSLIELNQILIYSFTMRKSEIIKIWFTGYNIKGKYLLIFSDGVLIDRLQITKRALVLKFFLQSVNFEYFTLKIKKISLLKIALIKIVNDKQQKKLNYKILLLFFIIYYYYVSPYP